MTTYRDLTEDEDLALQRWADFHGARWKEKLLNAWLTGHDVVPPAGCCHLRVLRNQLGPQWLKDYK